MEYQPLTIATVTSFAMFLYAAIASIGGKKTGAERETRLKRAISARATILAAGSESFGGWDSKGKYNHVTLNLKVSAPGRLPYHATTTWKVYPVAASRLQIGRELPVKIDANDSRIIYPNLSSVEFSWSTAKTGKKSA